MLSREILSKIRAHVLLSFVQTQLLPLSAQASESAGVCYHTGGSSPVFLALNGQADSAINPLRCPTFNFHLKLQLSASSSLSCCHKHSQTHDATHLMTSYPS